MCWKKWQFEWDDSLEKKLEMYGNPKEPRRWDSEQKRRRLEYLNNLKSFRLCPGYRRPSFKKTNIYQFLAFSIWLVLFTRSEITSYESVLYFVILYILLIFLGFLPPPRELYFKIKNLFCKREGSE